jgi:hypothetical protein
MIGQFYVIFPVANHTGWILLNRSELILPQLEFATAPEFPSYKTNGIGTFPRQRNIFGI